MQLALMVCCSVVLLSRFETLLHHSMRLAVLLCSVGKFVDTHTKFSAVISKWVQCLLLYILDLRPQASVCQARLQIVSIAAVHCQVFAVTPPLTGRSKHGYVTVIAATQTQKCNKMRQRIKAASLVTT